MTTQCEPRRHVWPVDPTTGAACQCGQFRYEFYRGGWVLQEHRPTGEQQQEGGGE